ncbi:MAG TPA: hypothetical protein VFP39_13840 [Gemmatimonadales bacterium]|nr:hypothetical protein [Gemmatimonadales bacterium]
MRTLPLLLAVALAVPSALNAQGQLHEPTVAEHRVLDPAISAITRVLDRFGDDDWDKTSDSFGDNVLVSDDPDVPLDIDQNFERTYSVRQDSNRWHAVIEPLMQQLQQSMAGSDYAAQRRVGGKIRSLSTVTVDVYINRADFSVDTTVTGTTRVTIAGAALAYRVPPDSGAESQGPTYTIGFGKWRGQRFAFVHRPKSAAIENIVVRITGADDRIRDVLAHVDWRMLGSVLTP